MGKHDRQATASDSTAVSPDPFPAADESKAEAEAPRALPRGLAIFKALLEGNTPHFELGPMHSVTRGSAMRPLQAAYLTIYACDHPDLMVEAMTPDEVRAWAGRLRMGNPVAWHKSRIGSVFAFAQAMGYNPTAVAGRYQTETSALMTAHTQYAARPAA